MVTSLQLVSPSLETMTYGLDGEGRWDSLTDSGTNIVTGPAPTGMYDAAGHVLNVQLTGSTPDQDIYTYDQNTGRMKTFEFEVGNTPSNLTGTLSWNPNGTLGELQIVDGFDSGGSETCYSNSSSALGYGYDDLGRLVEFDCGSGNWGQQFSYDQYDNLTQTVISGRSGGTWNPGYSSTNNQVNGATYDASGDTTNDGDGNVYGWNTGGRMAWTAASGTPTCGTSGRCITYDAFDRAVEISDNAAWTEWWYTQVPGSQVAMNGTTLKYSYWPTPGRGLYIGPSGGSHQFVHPDWLGNDRVVSTIGNHTIIADRAYAPYGQQYNTFGSTNPMYGFFAGMSGDFDGGVLFDTTNREFALAQGRWLSPDPAGWGWNQYGYVTNPNGEIDPSGLCPPGQKSCGGPPPGPPGVGCTDPSNTNPDCVRDRNTMNPSQDFDLFSFLSWFGCDNTESGICYNPYLFLGLFQPGGNCVDALINPCTGAANTGTTQPPAPLSRCGNSTSSPPASDIENLVTTFSSLMRPLNYAFVNASMFASSAGLFAAGGLAISGGCLEPTPAEPATCAAGIFAGAHAFAGGAVSGTAAVQFFTKYTLPAFKKWGC